MEHTLYFECQDTQYDDHNETDYDHSLENNCANSDEEKLAAIAANDKNVENDLSQNKKKLFREEDAVVAAIQFESELDGDANHGEPSNDGLASNDEIEKWIIEIQNGGEIETSEKSQETLFDFEVENTIYKSIKAESNNNWSMGLDEGRLYQSAETNILEELAKSQNKLSQITREKEILSHRLSIKTAELNSLNIHYQQEKRAKFDLEKISNRFRAQVKLQLASLENKCNELNRDKIQLKERYARLKGEVKKVEKDQMIDFIDYNNQIEQIEIKKEKEKHELNSTIEKLKSKVESMQIKLKSNAERSKLLKDELEKVKNALNKQMKDNEMIQIDTQYEINQLEKKCDQQEQSYKEQILEAQQKSKAEVEKLKNENQLKDDEMKRLKLIFQHVKTTIVGNVSQNNQVKELLPKEKEPVSMEVKDKQASLGKDRLTLNSTKTSAQKNTVVESSARVHAMENLDDSIEIIEIQPGPRFNSKRNVLSVPKIINDETPSDDEDTEKPRKKKLHK